MCQDLRQRSISVRQWSSWAWGNLPMGHQGEPPLCPCSAIHHCHSVISSSAGAGDSPEDECHPPGTVAVWGTCPDSASQPSVGDPLSPAVAPGVSLSRPIAFIYQEFTRLIPLHGTNPGLLFVKALPFCSTRAGASQGVLLSACWSLQWAVSTLLSPQAAF